MEDVKFLVRRPCPYYACVSGKDGDVKHVGDELSEPCPTCNGVAYIEEWESAKAVLREILGLEEE